MNAEAFRISGAIVSAAVIAVALAFSAAPRAEGDVYMLSVLPPAVANAPTPPEPVSFVVRFQGGGPIARAQASAAQGRESAAAARIVAELGRQRAFEGLCFDRFTQHAAEIVLQSCSDVAASERAMTQTRWLAALNAMPSVDYANPIGAGES